MRKHSDARLISEAIDDQVQQRAHARQAAEVAMITYERLGVEHPRCRRERCRVLRRPTGGYREPGASRAELHSRRRGQKAWSNSTDDGAADTRAGAGRGPRRQEDSEIAPLRLALA